MVRPLVYYVITIFMGCITCLVLMENYILGAVVTASFLAIMYFTINKKFFFIVLCFFIIGAVNYYCYFNVNLPTVQRVKVRVSQKNGFYCIASCDNKKIYLEGNIFELREGRTLWINGSFEKVPVYERGIVGTFTVTDYKVCKEDFMSTIENFRKNLYEGFSEILGKEKAALVMGVCFGDSGYIEKTEKEDFKKLGIIHVISVSGLHMSIVYEALEYIMGYKIALLASFLYMIFTGSQASTVRAFIMIFILKISRRVYKKYDSLSSLSLSAIILLIFKPFYILDIGFMLSFLCVLGIILYNKKIGKILYKLPAKINESFSLSISSQIFSMPYAVFSLKTFSLGFLFSNLALLPFYTIVVVLGNIGMICSAIYPLFNVVNYGMFTVLMIIEFIQKLLTTLLPDIVYFSYLDSLVVFGIYMCYLGVKKGYAQFKFVPLCIIFIIAYQNYKVFPEISYININSNDIVLLQYRKNTMVVTPGKINVKELKIPVRIDKIIEGYKGDSTLKISESYSIRLISEGSKLEAEVCFLEKQKSRNELAVSSSSMKEITTFKNSVKLKKSESYIPAGTIINKYIIIGNRILKFSQGLEEIL